MKDYVDMRQAGLAIVRDWCASESVTMAEATQTPFAYVDVRAVPLPSIQIANLLLREKGVLTVPGEVFGDEHTLRISFGRPAPQLCEGLSRISNLFHKIRN